MRTNASVLLTVLSLVALCALAASAQKETSGDATAAVAQVVRTQQDAWNRHDLDSFIAGYWNSPDLTFFSAPSKQAWLAGDVGPLPRHICESGARDGDAGVLRFAHRNARSGRGIRTRCVASDHAGWKNSARIVHSGVSQIPRRMEDCARPYISGGVTRSTVLACHERFWEGHDFQSRR